MILRRIVAVAAAGLVAAGLVVAVGVAAAPPAPAGPLKANPCLEVKNCKPTAGPWVAVPPTGEANFLLECPKRTGTIGGTDALASSTDVNVTWEGNPGSPVRPGTTTTFFAYFHASSAHGKAGLFQPYIGCIPQQKVKPRATVSARVTRPGQVIDPWQSLFVLKPGANQTASLTCGKKGERVLNGWYAVVFGVDKAPNPAFGSMVHVTLATTTGTAGKTVAAVQTGAGIPKSASVELQLGVTCAP